MEVAYEITMEDLLEYNRYFMEHSPTLRRARRRYTYLVVVFWMVCGILSAIVWHDTFGLTMLILFILVSLFWLFTAPGRWRRAVMRMTEKLYREGENRSVLGRHRMVLTPEGLENTSETGESKSRWGAVEKIEESEGLLLLFIGAAMAHLVPKRAFPEEAAFRQFAETARRYRAEAAAQEGVAS